MLNLQSDFFCPMIVMLSLNQAALLSVQLLVIHHVSAGIPVNELWNELVSTGESIMFTCNTSQINVTQIQWTKDKCSFVHSFILNQTFSNFSSHRLRIDRNLPSKMNIFNAQHEDSGLYICTTSGREGPMTMKWNFMVSEKPEKISFSWNFLYILIFAIGCLLCGVTSAVCLCRKLRARTQNRNPVQDQFHLQTGGEVVVPQLQAGTNMRTNNKHRSQYMERLNSIYGVN